MPTSGAGVYTLPSGINPVVAGTTIQDTWANPTLNDVAQGLTDRLDRSGRGAMLAPMKLVDGVVGLPGLVFGSELSSGWWRPGAGIWAFSNLGTEQFRFNATRGITLAAPASGSQLLATTGVPNVAQFGLTNTDSSNTGGAFQATNDAAITTALLVTGSAAPTYGGRLANEANLYSNRSINIMADNASGVIRFQTGGNATRAQISETGAFGIGMVPSNILDISQNVNGSALGKIINANAGTSAYSSWMLQNNGGTQLQLGQTSTTYTPSGAIVADAGFLYSSGVNGFAFLAPFATASLRFAAGGLAEQMRLSAAGNLLIGRTTDAGGSQLLQVGSGSAAARAALYSNDQYVLNIYGGGAGAYLVGANNSATPDLIFSNTAATERFRMTTDGRFYGTALHNNAGSMTGTANQYVGSGTQTGISSTTVANLSAVSNNVCRWMRVGNVVHVTGSALVTITALSTYTAFRCALPIPSAFTTGDQVAGIGRTTDGASTAAYANGDAANDEVLFNWTSGTLSGVRTFYYSYSYEVL